MGLWRPRPWASTCAALLVVATAGAAPAGVAETPAGAAPTLGTPVRTWDPAHPAPQSALAGLSRTERTAATSSRTFQLHSLRGSQHTIFLDFDGATVSGTAWNAPDIGLPDGTYPGWVLDGQPRMGTVQRKAIDVIWRRVAEDFAPFDVDVTTQDPGPDALDRSGPDDPTYGTHVLVSSSRAATRATCPEVCSGSAWFDVFDLAVGHDLVQPAWVFPDVLGDDAKDIAETISHEVGHNFGLLHDGNAREDYDGGHRSWAPIMGAGFDRPITQWSRGDYAGANNQQDDLAIIAANGAPLRADEAPDQVAGAGPPPTGPAYITTDADRDVYALGSCRGDVVLTALPAPVGPDLDVRLRLLRADGSLVTAANPRSRMLSRYRAGGLAATISTRLPAGRYFVSVTGVGHRGAVEGYDGYASLGAYTLTQSGCEP